MENPVRTVFLSITALTFSGSLSADDYHESGVATKYDHNRDGIITREEYDQGYERKMKKKLEWLDTNNDGVISPEEFRHQHRIEYDQRWSMWDADGDGTVSVQAILEQNQESRANMKKQEKPGSDSD